MRIRFLIRKAAEYVFRRKGNFLLTTLVIATALYMLCDVFQMSAKSTYYIYETEHVFTDTDFVNVNILMTEQGSNGYDENVGQFLDRLKDQYGERAGKFMLLPVNYIQEGTEKRADTLYVDENLFDLCRVSFTEEETPADDTDMLYGYVCKEKLGEFPVGTILENANLGTKTRIVGYFEKGEKWAENLLFHSKDAVVCLDDYIVSVMDDAYFESSPLFYTNIYNSVYVRTMQGEQMGELKFAVKALAKECGIKCYVNTMEDLVAAQRQENAELWKAIGIMLCFAIFVAMLGVGTAFLSDVFCWQKELAIMHVCGVSRFDLFWVIAFENLLKAVLGVGAAFGLFAHSLDQADRMIFVQRVVPGVLVGVVVFIVCASGIAFRAIWRKKVMTIIGEARL